MGSHTMWPFVTGFLSLHRMLLSFIQVIVIYQYFIPCYYQTIFHCMCIYIHFFIFKSCSRKHMTFTILTIFFSLYNIVLVLPYIDMNLPWVYNVFPILNPPSHLPLHPIPLGHPSAPALSYLNHF